MKHDDPRAQAIANRRDHYIPQAYLRGFIAPTRRDLPPPLWHFDKNNGVWSKRSPRELGYRYGFYDYTVAEMGVETADAAFAHLERTFSKNSEGATAESLPRLENSPRLLIALRPNDAREIPLFFEDQRKDGKNLRALFVEEVNADGKSIRVRSMTPEPLPESFIKNWTITNMRKEIAKGAD